MKSTIVLVKIFLENLIKDKFFAFVFFSGLVFGIISITLNEVSYGANEFIIRSFSLGFLSILTNFLGVFFGLSMIHGDGVRNSIKILLCKPVNRFEIILAPVIAFVIGLIVALSLAVIEFFILFKSFGVKVDYSFIISVFGIFYEGIIIFCISMLFRNIANNLISSMIVFCVYLFGHSYEELLQISFIERSSLISNSILFVSKILPDLTYFDFKHLAYNNPDYLNFFFNGSAYFIFCFIVLIVMLGTIFSRQDYH